MEGEFSLKSYITIEERNMSEVLKSKYIKVLNLILFKLPFKIFFLFISLCYECGNFLLLFFTSKPKEIKMRKKLYYSIHLAEDF